MIKHFVTFVIVLLVVVPACSKFKKHDTGVNEPMFDWIDGLRSNVREVIKDPGTANDILKLVNKMEHELLEVDDHVRAYYKRLVKLDADYNAPRADFEKAVDDFNAQIRQTRSRIMDLRFAMKDLCSEEEWQSLSDMDKSLLASWQRQPSIPKP